MGVIVPRYSHSAVERNLVKRRLRELARTEMLPMMPALDVVIRATPGAYGARHDELRLALRNAVDRIRQNTAENGRERQ